MAERSEIGFACRCGEMNGAIENALPGGGTHALCHCADCHRGHQHFGLDYDRADGLHIFQTTPDRLRFDGGQEHLALMRLSSKGLMRWYASCCNTPMFNTLSGPGLPFVGVMAEVLNAPEALGPVDMEGFIEAPDGKLKHRHFLRGVMAFLRRALAAKLSGRGRQTPFFDSQGQPVAEAVLAERES